MLLRETVKVLGSYFQKWECYPVCYPRRMPVSKVPIAGYAALIEIAPLSLVAGLLRAYFSFLLEISKMGLTFVGVELPTAQGG